MNRDGNGMSYVTEDGGRSIRCLRCGMKSFDPVDVERKGCKLCKMTHEEYERLGLESERPKTPFVSGERVCRHGCSYEVLSNAGYYGSVVDEDGNEIFPFFWFHEGAWCRRT